MHLRFYLTGDESLARDVAAELAAHGTLVPPWIKYPEIPRRSIGWRMGSGEWYLDLWRYWWERLDAAAREAYVARWTPDRPDAWSNWVTSAS